MPAVMSNPSHVARTRTKGSGGSKAGPASYKLSAPWGKRPTPTVGELRLDNGLYLAPVDLTTDKLLSLR